MISTTMGRIRTKRIGVVLLWVIFWQIGAMAVGEEILLPSPLAVFGALVGLLTQSSFWLALLASFFRIAAGYVLAVFLGAVLALQGYEHPFLDAFLHPFVLFLRSIPLAGFVLLLLIWVPKQALTTAVVFSVGFPIIYENMKRGFASMDANLLEMARFFHVSKKLRYTMLYCDEVKPYLVSALTTVSGLALKGGISAEVFGTLRHSVGEGLYRAKIYLEIPELFAWIAVIFVVSFLLEKLVRKVLERI